MACAPVLSDVASAQWKKSKETRTPYPYSLRVINNELWCCINQAIIVYNDQLVQQRRINKPDTGRVYDVTEVSNDKVAVAAVSSLYIVNYKGETLQTIENGDFTGVQCHAGRLYAAEFKTHTIGVYDINNGFNKLHTFNVQCIGTDHYATLAVANDTITACCFNTTILYEMTLEGELNAKPGEPGSGAAGQLNGPYVHQCDDSAVLVADRYNGRVQALDAHGRWSVIDIEPEIDGEPRSALYHNNHLYVAKGNDNRENMIIQYALDH